MGAISLGGAMQIKWKDVRVIQRALMELGIRATQDKIYELGYLGNLYNELELSFKDRVKVFLAFARNRAAMNQHPEATRFWEDKISALENYHFL